MTRSSEVFRAGARSSNLSLVQARAALDAITALAPGIAFDLIPCSSPGDRDRVTDLRDTPPDFFTRDIDCAVLDGSLDCGVHSAKDLPAPMTPGLDWLWLPWREDRRDALVLPLGAALDTLPPEPHIGVSSGRREQYARRRFPRARLLSIRGSIEQRIAQLDEGKYDLLIMAGAALNRLGLAGRIAEWIPPGELEPPEGQGALAITFRAADARMLRLRSLFVHAVTFAGAGSGRAELCTIAAAAALETCDVCFHDTLMDAALLDRVPAHAARIDVGKRCGRHSVAQDDISRMIADYARRGLRVVRLKGGDPGIFGRLAEEIDVLDAHHLPYRVIPGISSLQAATTGTGMLLTRRGVSRGFTAMTPRAEGGGPAAVDAGARAALPLVLFMAVKVAGDVAAQLVADGVDAATPCAFVFDAGACDERIVRCTLGAVASGPHGAAADETAPGLLIVGGVTRYSYHPDFSAFQGRRILLTCSAALQEEACRLVEWLGGLPVPLPLIRLTPTEAARSELSRIDAFGAIVLTSPSAVDCLFSLLTSTRVDVRRLRRVIVCGPGTARALERHNVHADVTPGAEFGAAGLVQALEGLELRGMRVLRLRSEKAGSAIADALRGQGAEVTDCVLYESERVCHDTLPAFDAVFFASASAVEAYLAQWPPDTLTGRHVCGIGVPTFEALARAGVGHARAAAEATVEGGIRALAALFVEHALKCLHAA